jgi:hypothetical protein
MSKNTLTREIERELEKLNDTIDHKIIKGLPYKTEARRHKELSATLRKVVSDEEDGSDEVSQVSRRRVRKGASPARRRLERGVFALMFGFGLAG